MTVPGAPFVNPMREEFDLVRSKHSGLRPHPFWGSFLKGNQKEQGHFPTRSTSRVGFKQKASRHGLKVSHAVQWPLNPFPLTLQNIVLAHQGVPCDLSGDLGNLSEALRNEETQSYRTLLEMLGSRRSDFGAPTFWASLEETKRAQPGLRE